jgi:hypothetical protein
VGLTGQNGLPGLTSYDLLHHQPILAIAKLSLLPLALERKRIRSELAFEIYREGVYAAATRLRLSAQASRTWIVGLQRLPPDFAISFRLL